jgi:hypothetical protein
MLRAAIGSLGFALSLALVAPAGAWEGEMAGLVKAIAEVKSTAESGDFVVIEGRVADVQSGNVAAVPAVPTHRSVGVPASGGVGTERTSTAPTPPGQCGCSVSSASRTDSAVRRTDSPPVAVTKFISVQERGERAGLIRGGREARRRWELLRRARRRVVTS